MYRRRFACRLLNWRTTLVDDDRRRRRGVDDHSTAAARRTGADNDGATTRGRRAHDDSGSRGGTDHHSRARRRPHHHTRPAYGSRPDHHPRVTHPSTRPVPVDPHTAHAIISRRYPNDAGSSRRPVTALPDIAATIPAIVTTDPDVTRPWRRGANDVGPRGRRRGIANDHRPRGDDNRSGRGDRGRHRRRTGVDDTAAEGRRHQQGQSYQDIGVGRTMLHGDLLSSSRMSARCS